MPLAQGWPLSEEAQKKIDNKERKPSKEIRVEALRDCIEFCQRTSARGRGKAVLVYPAERMNGISANALLKSLEEPPGDVKFVLATESAHQLLPTIRSRCVSHTMAWPTEAQSLAWLVGQGQPEAQAQSLLKASGQRPQDALDWFQAGHDASAWAQFPKAMQRGDVGLIKDWTVVELLKSLHKLCHDLMVQKVGGEPRYFNAAELPSMVQASLHRLAQWSRELTQALRTADHPFSAGLMQEALVSQARQAMAAPAGQTTSRAGNGR
jgi:DNA polymerase III subunit delta'